MLKHWEERSSNEKIMLDIHCRDLIYERHLKTPFLIAFYTMLTSSISHIPQVMLDNEDFRKAEHKNGNLRMEYMSKKHQSTAASNKRKEKIITYSVPLYFNEEMIEELQYVDASDDERTRIMKLWKSNYGHLDTLRDTQHSLQYNKEYPSTSYYEDTLIDKCNNVELSPVTGVIRTAVKKAGVTMKEDKRRVSRQFLTSLNIAQLQVIVNDLQRYIELLNDELVQLLMKRDELQMSQDATLIDIEDLSLYF